MTDTRESLMEVTRRCFANASRVNPESPGRRTLRTLMRWWELEVAEALLTLDRIAQLDPTRADVDVHEVVRDARAAVAPFWERRP